MRWKLSKESFRENESQSTDSKQMLNEINQKNNVFTITQLTPSDLTNITTTATRKIDDNNKLSLSSLTHERYKQKLNDEISNFNDEINRTIKLSTNETSPDIRRISPTSTLTSPSTTATLDSLPTSHLLLNNNNGSHQQFNYHINRNRRSSYEEAFNFTGPDYDDKYYQNLHNNKNDNGNIFVISSNHIDKQQQFCKDKFVPWTNQEQKQQQQHQQQKRNQKNLNTNTNTQTATTKITQSTTIDKHNTVNDDLNHNNNIKNTLKTPITLENGNCYNNIICNIDDGINLSNNNTIITTTTTATATTQTTTSITTTTNFHHYASSMTTTHPSTNGSLNNTKIGSTTKLLPNATDDQSSTQIQTKCSYFGGLVLCLCLNITYTNIIRFPREFDNYGTAYLIPYFIMLFLVGLPIILLEVSIGQFLGQGAANSWRASPIFKGASVISRLASWLATIWISMQATLAITYIGMLILKAVPFSECSSGVKITADIGYKEIEKSGQICIQKTFLSPIWINAQYFGFLTLGLIILWIIMLICTYNGKIFRRTSFFIGTLGFLLLITLAGWEIYKSLGKQYFPELWNFNKTLLIDSSIWFSALIQVIYSTNIGFGVIPVVTGKFLHKGDAIRTTVLYFCFNLFVNVISIILFMVQFDNRVTRESENSLMELKPLTAVYDKIIDETDLLSTKIIPIIIYSVFIISAMVSISIAIYTSSRLVPKHPSYVLNLLGLIFAVMALLGPKYVIARVLDSRIVGTLVVSALIFDLISITWVYGVQNIRTDLEFSIGRTIYLIWLILWCISPIILTVILVWWCIGDDRFDLLNSISPRWAPIAFVIAIILVIACIEIFKQVDYNFIGMICEAAKPAKEWGPADPLARHAWKQWRSVCQDTGRKDFTLRRRGTRDYTHSIKRGQYSTTAKYGTQNWKSSTPGNSSPNYSGSVFGDSAIEEDMSVDKYSAGIDGQFTTFSSDNNVIRPIRYSNRSRKISREHARQSRHNSTATNPDRHREVVYIRRLSNDRSNATKIEITPTNESIVYPSSITRNSTPSSSSLTRIPVQQNSRLNNSNSFHYLHNHNQRKDLPVPVSRKVTNSDENNDHICWRKFSVNSEEYSTEL